MDGRRTLLRVVTKRKEMNWIVHQENICILGLQGSGKTTLVKNMLDKNSTLPRLIISPQKPMQLYGQYGDPVYTIKELQKNKAMVWMDYSLDPMDLIEKIAEKLMTFDNFLLVVDDAHEYCSKQKMPPHWKRLVNSGRNRGVTSINITPAPNLLHNIIMQSSQHMISFQFMLESQVEYARKNFFGDIGYLLLPQKPRPYQFRKYRQMNQHEYIYRSKESEIKFYLEDGSFIILDSIEDFPKDDTIKEIDESKVTEDSEDSEVTEVTEVTEDSETPTELEDKINDK